MAEHVCLKMSLRRTKSTIISWDGSIIIWYTTVLSLTIVTPNSDTGQDPEVHMRGRDLGRKVLMRGGGPGVGGIGHTPGLGQGHTTDEDQGREAAHPHTRQAETSHQPRADHEPRREIDADQRTKFLPWQTVHTFIRLLLQELNDLDLLCLVMVIRVHW